MTFYFNRRVTLCVTMTLALISFISISLKLDLHHKVSDHLFEVPSPESPPPPPPPSPPRYPLYKPASTKPPIQIVDNFPLAAAAASKDELPPIPSWNIPPRTHVPEKTPLFIGFTRNWRILQQAVVCYITAGWPPEDIYIIENTGTMDANMNGLLTLQNPFHLNHTRLHDIFGVNIIVTPTLLTFAQLQNFMLWTAIEKKYPTYFWSHMDMVGLSFEDRKPYKSLYTLAIDVLRESLDPSYQVDEATGKKQRWGIRFFEFDLLALVNTKAYEEVGGWDTQIPFYMTDCDMHQRLSMSGFKQQNAQAASIYDVADSLDDLEVLYRKKGKEPSFAVTEGDNWAKEEPIPKREIGEVAEQGELLDDNKKEQWEEDIINSPTYHKLVDTCDAMQRHKLEQEGGRNSWQSRQGGIGVEKEPYVVFLFSLIYCPHVD